MAHYIDADFASESPESDNAIVESRYNAIARYADSPSLLEVYSEFVIQGAPIRKVLRKYGIKDEQTLRRIIRSAEDYLAAEVIPNHNQLTARSVERIEAIYRKAMQGASGKRDQTKYLSVALKSVAEMARILGLGNPSNVTAIDARSVTVNVQDLSDEQLEILANLPS